jgi:hypothetical protein
VILPLLKTVLKARTHLGLYTLPPLKASLTHVLYLRLILELTLALLNYKLVFLIHLLALLLTASLRTGAKAGVTLPALKAFLMTTTLEGKRQPH